ncbi:hypothetical protein [Deinococcus ruber]|uniref:Uncharacterized protein n=1 Tax=Deinococcus ruber TaxID=1848197 RepID=A0A918C3I5_9DEIO|nr:hypothetical protein [Deinococcus ruber]GGR04026.1 hypothetical protein GCM10008957_16230 [Deinococcus ruber]
MVIPRPYVQRWMEARSLKFTAPVVLEDDGASGASSFIDVAATPQRPLIWLEAVDGDQHDPLLLGNKLAEAVSRALNVQLFGYGMPWTYGTEMLRRSVHRLGPWTLALSGAEHAPLLARTLLSLHDGQSITLLQTGQPLPQDVLYRSVTRLGAEELRVTPQELLTWLTHRAHDPQALLDLHARCQGQFRPLMSHLARLLALPTPAEPSPTGPRFMPGDGVEVDPQRLLAALVHQKRWNEALEIAVAIQPACVPTLLVHAGPQYHERGLHPRLYELLGRLPDDLIGSETVLRWRYSAALRLGAAAPLRPVIQTFLAEHEAPELRALYAGTALTLEHRKDEIRRAAQAQTTPLTLYYHGLSLAEEAPQEALAVLRDSVESAEHVGTPHDVVRNVQALAATCTQAGQYLHALHWTGYALRQYDHNRLGDWQRRLSALNEWAYTSLLCGRLGGVAETLAAAEDELRAGAPQLTSIFTTTLGDHALVRGDALAALRHYEHARRSHPRTHQGWSSTQLVRALVELGQPEQALARAEEAYSLTQHEAASYARWSTLALGMALAYVRPAQAIAHLEAAMNAFERPLKADTLVRAAAHLAYAYLQQRQRDQAVAALARVEPYLQELGDSGRLLLGGPLTLFADVWNLTAPPAGLSLQLLGSAEVRWADRTLKLQRRQLEMLVLMTLRPEGLGGDRFVSLLYRDELAARSSLKAGLSRLRDLIPIGSQPYRLLTPVRADFVEVMSLLQAGQVAEAVRRYAGPLLPDSDAPGIVEYRELLDETLKRAVIAHRDPALLTHLASVLRDDLEIWEAAADRMTTHDPQRPLALSRIQQLRQELA